MIESQEGLAAVDEIAAVPEVDVLFVAPYDMSLALGILEQFDNPIFLRERSKSDQCRDEGWISRGACRPNTCRYSSELVKWARVS